MIQCPRCHAMLQDWATECEFCQADTTQVERPTPEGPKRHYGHFDVPQWVRTAYYVFAVWWVVDGALNLLAGLAGMLDLSSVWTSANPLVYQHHSVLTPYLDLLFGVLTVIGGLGLLLESDLIRACVTWIAGLRIFWGLVDLLFFLTAGAFLGLFGVLAVILRLLGIFASAMVIYVIGETDKQAYI